MRPVIPALLTRIDSGPEPGLGLLDGRGDLVLRADVADEVQPVELRGDGPGQLGIAVEHGDPAPAAWSRRAIPAPIPWPAPVTSATWPSSRKNSAIDPPRTGFTESPDELHRNNLSRPERLGHRDEASKRIVTNLQGGLNHRAGRF